MAQVLGFGAEGPLKDVAGFDMTAYMSRGGLLATTLSRGNSPMLPTNGYGDFQVAFVLLSGILGALMQRERSGEGDYVTTSLPLSLRGVRAERGDDLGAARQPVSKDRREVINPFNNTYFGCDGGLMAMCAAEYDRDFDKILKLVGREDPVGEERLNICDNLNANGGLNGEVVDILDEALAKQPMDHWLTLFLENDVPLEKCQLPQDGYDDEQAWASDMLRKVTYKTGAVRMIPTNPVRFQSQGNPELRVSRGQGSDTEDILVELGYSPEQITKILESGGCVSLNERK